MNSVLREGNVFISFLENVPSSDTMNWTICFFIFRPWKFFVLIKTSGSRRVLSSGKSVEAPEFHSLGLQVFDEFPKQHVALSCSNITSFPLNCCLLIIELLTFLLRIRLSIYTAFLYWKSNLVTEWKSNVFRVSNIPWSLQCFVCNPLFMSNYHPVDVLHFIPSK